MDLSDWSAVPAAMGRPAPSAAETAGGLLTVRLAGATTYSASPSPFCNSQDNVRLTNIYRQMLPETTFTYKRVQHGNNFISWCEIFHSWTNINNYSCDVGHCRKRTSRDEAVSKFSHESSLATSSHILLISGNRDRGWLLIS
jgi:hypothetical protein